MLILWRKLGIYGSQYVLLTLSWRRPLSYRNQSIDLLCKSKYWFLYDNGPRHERVKRIYIYGTHHSFIAVESRHAENVSTKSSKSQVLIYWAGKGESADVDEHGTSELVIQHLILFAIVENAH